ncbi:hypothetical protein ACLB2K_016950 [Fragaria x ananassa]
MARGVLKSLAIFAILLAAFLLSAQFSSVEARPLTTSRSSSRNGVVARESTEDNAMKSSSTSGGSRLSAGGHRLVNFQRLATALNRQRDQPLLRPLHHPSDLCTKTGQNTATVLLIVVSQIADVEPDGYVQLKKM